MMSFQSQSQGSVAVAAVVGIIIAVTPPTMVYSNSDSHFITFVYGISLTHQQVPQTRDRRHRNRLAVQNARRSRLIQLRRESSTNAFVAGGMALRLMQRRPMGCNVRALLNQPGLLYKTFVLYSSILGRTSQRWWATPLFVVYWLCSLLETPFKTNTVLIW